MQGKLEKHYIYLPCSNTLYPFIPRAALENLSSTVEALALKVEALSWTNQMTRAKDEQMMQEIDRKTR